MASPVNSPHFPTPPPPPSPNNSTTVIIVVFVSFACLCFLAFCLFALWCFISKRYKKKTLQETDIIHSKEHRSIKGAIVEGPRGPHSVVLSVEDDKHIEEEIIKNEKLGKNMHAKSPEIIDSKDIESGESSSTSNQKA
ncbi:tracheary element differentiation-related 6 [Abeliophyllum distichum]|uniref:Tracheary element differentiation-related 6 n=1 Tax=Abeliophyllum distichum TaxID=126358 RepID=A0ABD1V9C0_9LAMI